MTPTEKHLRDILNTVKARLRGLENSPEHSPALRVEIRKVADMIAARLDLRVEGDE